MESRDTNGELTRDEATPTIRFLLPNSRETRRANRKEPILHKDSDEEQYDYEREELTTKEVAEILEARVPKYSGEEEEPFITWLRKFVEVLERFQIPKKKAQNMLAMHLTDAARLVYDNITDPQKKSWEELVQELAKKMKNPWTIREARRELFQMKQGSESVGKFAKAIKSKVEIAFQGYPTTQLEENKMSFFLNGLRPDIKRTIQRQNTPQSFQELITMAQNEEQLLKHEKSEELERMDMVNVLRLEDQMEDMQKKLKQMQMTPQMKANRNEDRRITSYNRNEGTKETRGRAYKGSYFSRRDGAQRSRGPFMNNYGNNRGRPWYQWRPPFVNNRQQNYHERYNGSQQYWRNQQNYALPPPPQRAITPYHHEEEAYVQSLPTTNNSTRFMPSISTILTLCMLMTVACANPTQYQICGFHEGGWLYAPPILPKYHTVTVEDPLQEMLTIVYAENQKPFKMKALKCFKEVFVMKIESFLGIRTRSTVLHRARKAVSEKECRSAQEEGKICGEELRAFRPYVKRTKIVDSDTEIAMWEIQKKTRYAYNVEYGEIATPDGTTVTTNLGDTSGCKLSDSYCVRDHYIIIWDKVIPETWCRYKEVGKYRALVTTNTIAVKELDTIFEIEEKDIAAHNVIRHCHISNAYFTKSGEILAFPQIGMNESISERVSRNEFTSRREKRGYITRDSPQEGQQIVYIVDYIDQKLKNRIFDQTAETYIPYFSTRPITNGRILDEIRRWRVTNNMIQIRFNTYEKEDERISVLRTIRYAEYTELQRIVMASIRTKRPFTMAEEALMQDLDKWTNDIFDPYLDREFGPLKVVVDKARLEKGGGPFFLENQPSQHYAPNTTTLRPISRTTTTTTFAKTAQRYTETPTRNTHVETQPVRRTNQLHLVDTVQHRETHEEEGKPMHIEKNAPTQTKTTQEREKTTVELEIGKLHRRRQLMDQYNNIFHSHYNKLSISIALMRFDTTMAVRVLFDRTDIAAKFVGEVLLISKCRQVTPEKIHWSRRLNDTCYTLVPVELENDIWFIPPGSHDLVESSELEKCGETPYTVRRENGKWRTEYGEAEVNHIPVNHEESNNLKRHLGVELLGEQQLFYNNDQHAYPFQVTAWIKRINDILPKYPAAGKHLIQEAQRIRQGVNKSLTSIYDQAAEQFDGVRDRIANNFKKFAWGIVGIPLMVTLP